MKVAFALLLAGLVAAPANAAVRRLSECGTLPATISEAAPFDLDQCWQLASGDDVTQLLTDIQAQWPGGFYVRAPSKSMSVTASYTAWPATTPVYMFLEDQSSTNKFTITQIPVSSACTGAACVAYWTLWSFTNYTTVKIGGPNLSITLVGNHPGFANCVAQQPYIKEVTGNPNGDSICDANRGLVDARVTNKSSPTLFDLRANIRYAMQYGLYMTGQNPQYYELDSSGHTKNCNVAGTFYATSGIFFHDGACRDVWMDPERTVIVDPYLRGNGWQGQIVPGPAGGRPVACADNDQDQVRQSGGAAYYSSSITGGVTIQHGGAGWGQRLTQYVGSGVKSPFIVRIQDWGTTGPIEKTCPFTVAGSCAPGARGRATTEANFFKGDPHNRPDTGTQIRFVRFMLLTPKYGNGWTNQAFAGCANSLNGNPGGSDDGQFARLENNSLGPTSVTRDWSIEFAGDWRTVAQGGTFTRGSPALVMSFYEDTGRSYRHVARLADGAVFADTIRLVDTDTATGPGIWPSLEIGPGYGTTTCNANKVTNTNVSGVVTVMASCATATTISNVNFTGASRAVITIGTGSSVTASALCVPAGSTITGSGQLTYDGTARTLPYTISPTTGCNLATIADPAPSPPTGGVVN